MNVSFAGCGFLGLYHVGVASCLKTYAPQLYLRKVAGASAGSMAAVALLADLPLGEMTSNVLKIATEARKRTLGPFSPSFNITQIIADGLIKMLPDDVHLKVNGKLHVSLTKVYDGKNILVSQFESKQEVIDVVLASTFIPIFSGWLPPRYRGTRVIDGGYSDNLPILDGQTITVSPFCGSSDICPQDDYMLNVLQVQIAGSSIELSKENLFRLSRVLLPPDPEVLSKYCKQGFDDALRFLQKSYLISCTRCLAVDSTYEIEEDQGHNGNSGCAVYDANCLECKLQRHLADQSSVPESVWQVFEDAIGEAENGLTDWLTTINSFRIVRLLTYPASLPIGVAKSLISRLTRLLPTLPKYSLVRKTAEGLIEQLYRYAADGGYLLKPMNHKAKYTCELNITQYGEDSMEDLTKYSQQEGKESVKDILNLGFTAHLESDVAPHLPQDQADAIRFQHQNLAAAATQATSRGHSLVTSRIPSRAMSKAASRMGSRSDSMNSLFNLDGPMPDTIGQIQHVTESQEAVMSFYYTGQDNQVKVMEIFDVTQTDPFLLVSDDLGVNYTSENLLMHTLLSSSDLKSTSNSRLRHLSGPAAASRQRHSSDSAFTYNKHPNRRSRKISLGTTQFKVGDGESDNEETDDAPNSQTG